MKLFKLYVLVSLMCIGSLVHAQIYPVQSTPQLIPPYSVYLSDYATPGTDKLRVILVQRDLTQPSYQLRLVMSVELNGKVIMRTARTYNPAPISLNPGIPTSISGAELAPYLDSRNIDFVGYSREQYERTKALPEGSYQITFTAYDYRRQDVQVSNAGGSFYYLSKSEPPLINYPACGTKIPMRTPQQIIFSWLSRNTSSPTSVADTYYEFALYETRPVGRNPNDVVLSTQPVFRTNVDYAQLVYSPAEPLLLEGMQYVWRVRAIDRNGKDAFRNNGYSEACTFTYGGTDPDFDIGIAKDLQAVGETESRARIWWQMGEYDGYRVNYRKTGEGYEWFTSNVTTDELKLAKKTEGEVKLFGLEPDTEYETRVQVKKSGYFGGYTDIVKFRTEPRRVAQCGENLILPQGDLTKPLRSAIKGTIIQVDDIEVQLTDIVHLSEGWYEGYGRTSIPYLGGAVFAVKFDRLFIDENRVAGLGRIDFITNGTADLVAQQLANQEQKNKEHIQQENREAWAGTEFYDKVFVYDQIDIETITAASASLVSITDINGNVTGNAEVMQVLTSVPDKAIIIQDKSGDQFVVQKDKVTGEVKVTKVEGGGLGSGNTSVVDTGATVQTDPIKDRIIVLVLEQFEEEIAAWLRINGKGGEEDTDVLLAAELPDVLPKHAAFLKHLQVEVIPYFKEHPEKLRADSGLQQINKAILDRIDNLFQSSDDVDWTKIDIDDQETIRGFTANSLMNLWSGKINTSEIVDLTPDCGRTHAGKDKPSGSLYLISYPKECTYMREEIVNYLISKSFSKYLCAQERFNLIACLATGIVSGGEEQSIITLLNETPKAQAPALLLLLNTDNTGVLGDINDGFQFGNYVSVFKAIQQLYLSGTTKDAIDAEVKIINNIFLSDKTRAEKAQQNYFTWFEGGLLKSFFSDNFVFNRFDKVSISDNGTIQFNYATDPTQTGQTTTQITLKPFALVGIRVRGNTNEVLEAGAGDVVYVPGIMLPLLISKKETAEFIDALNATAVATGLGSVVTGATRFVIISGGIDILLGGSALVVDSYKDDILKMQNGEVFLDAYVLVNKAFLIYFGSRIILQLTQALPKLSSAFSTFKNSDDFAKLKTTNSSKASQIEKEIDDLIKKSEELVIINTGEGFTKLKLKRAELGLSPAGAAADDATASYLKVADQEFYGVNSKYQSPKTNVTLKVNAQTKTHAEAEVVQNAVDAGMKGKAKSAEMWVDRDPCKACGVNNGIGSLARELGVEKIIVHSPSGTQIFYPPK